MLHPPPRRNTLSWLEVHLETDIFSLEPQATQDTYMLQSVVEGKKPHAVRTATEVEKAIKAAAKGSKKREAKPTKTASHEDDKRRVQEDERKRTQEERTVTNERGTSRQAKINYNLLIGGLMQAGRFQLDKWSVTLPRPGYGGMPRYIR